MCPAGQETTLHCLRRKYEVEVEARRPHLRKQALQFANYDSMSLDHPALLELGGILVYSPGELR